MQLPLACRADLVPPVWGRAVYGKRDLSPSAVDQDAYVLCVLEQLRAAGDGGGDAARVDVPDLLLGVHVWTGYLDAYTHASGASARVEDLPISVAALLVAEACNVGLTPVVKPGVPALTHEFSPRIADLTDQRVWRVTLPGAPKADYGPLNAIAGHRVDLNRIRRPDSC